MTQHPRESLSPFLSKLTAARAHGREVMVALVRATTDVGELMRWYLAPGDLLLPQDDGCAVLVLEASRAQALRLGEGVLQNLHNAEYQGVFLQAWGSTRDHGYGAVDILAALYALMGEWEAAGEGMAVGLATPEVVVDDARQAGLQ